MKMETGLLAGAVPFIRGGAGAREALVFFGVNALFRRLDQVPNPGRYARQVSRLLPRHRFTILGYPFAAAPGAAEGRFDSMLEPVAAAMREPPDLVAGISLGGFMAMRFAAHYPSLVNRLALLVTAHRFSAAGWRRMERQFDALERGDLPALIRDNALLFRRPWYNWLVRLKLSKEGDRIAQGFRDAAEILRDYRELFSSEFARHADHARRIAAPTLLLGGGADQYFDPEAMRETAAMIPGARLRLFDRETHMLPIERSAAVARCLADFRAAT